MRAGAGWAAEVRRLAAQRDAVILAHNYQAPEIQDVADHVGDSLALSRLAAASTASVIVFAGRLLHGRNRQDPRPGPDGADPGIAGRLLAGRQHHRAPGPRVEGRAPRRRGGRLREHQRRGQGGIRPVLHLGQRGADRGVRPGATGRCCSCPTSSSAPTCSASPGRANMHIWLGECHVHAGISPAELRRKASAEPAAELFIHPECGCSTAALWQAGHGRPAAGPDPGAVHRRHAGGRPHHHGARRAGGHRDRHAAPAAPGQPGRSLGAGQPGRRMPVHEDDHAGRPAALPARGHHRGDRRSRGGPPGPPRRPGDARRRVIASARLGMAGGGQ